MKKRYNLYLESEAYQYAERVAGKGEVSSYIAELIQKDWASSLSGDLSDSEIARLPASVVKELMRLQTRNKQGLRTESSLPNPSASQPKPKPKPLRERPRPADKEVRPAGGSNKISDTAA